MASAPNSGEAAKRLIGRLFSGLAVLGAVAAFGLWVWFVISDWSRIWGRIASTFGADRPDRASKLEVGWFAVGWAVGPVVAAFAIWTLGNVLDGLWCRITGANRSSSSGPRPPA